VQSTSAEIAIIMAVALAVTNCYEYSSSFGTKSKFNQ